MILGIFIFFPILLFFLMGFLIKEKLEVIFLRWTPFSKMGGEQNKKFGGRGRGGFF